MDKYKCFFFFIRGWRGVYYVVDGRLLGVVVLSGLQAARVASAGKRDGFAIMSVVLLKFRSELKTTVEIKTVVILWNFGKSKATNGSYQVAELSGNNTDLPSLKHFARDLRT